MCGRVCSGATPACDGVMGVCAAGCIGTQTRCGAACTDLNTDPLNCGACGYSCPAPPGAYARTCLGATCQYGRVCDRSDFRADCDHSAGNGYEVDLNTDARNCGACGRTCGAGASCCYGTCQVGMCTPPC
jgi:hypothetical protein